MAVDPSLTTPAAWTRGVAAASVLLLIMLGLAWELWLAPTGSGTLALKVVPLLLPLPGLARNRLYTYRWLSLMVWLYFTEGVVRATSEHGTGAVLAGIEVLLCLLLFAACAAHVRWQLRQAASAEPVVAPDIAPVLAAVLAPTVAPVVGPIVAPVVAPIVAPVVAASTELAPRPPR